MTKREYLEASIVLEDAYETYTDAKAKVVADDTPANDKAYNDAKNHLHEVRLTARALKAEMEQAPGEARPATISAKMTKGT